jgi:hypothetical protein
MKILTFAKNLNNYVQYLTSSRILPKCQNILQFQVNSIFT